MLPLESRIIVPFSGGKPRDVRLVDAAVQARIGDCAVDGGPWPLVFIGDPGTGKTCAALALLDHYIGCRKFFTVAGLCDELIAVQQGKREYGQAPDTIGQWWERWRDAGLTVLDELGTRGNVSDFHYEAVKRAIDEREGRPSVFISNDTLDRIAQVYDDRIASRLAGGTVIAFTGPDRRVSR